MKLGIFYKLILAALENREIESVEEGVRKLAKLGIFYFEVDADMIAGDRAEERLLSAFSACGAQVSNLYFKRELTSLKSKDLDRLMADTEKIIGQCARLGCKQLMPVITVSDDLFQTPENAARAVCDYYRTTAELTDAQGIKTVFENGAVPQSFRLTLEDIGALLEESFKLGYLFDAGNFWFANIDPKEALGRFGGRIQSLHLKDVLPDAAGTYRVLEKRAFFPALGKGIAPIKEILQLVEKCGNAPVLTIEMESQKSVFASVEESVRFLQREMPSLEWQEYDRMLLDYAAPYGGIDPRIELKTHHTLCVASLIDRIAADLQLDLRMQKLAHIVGLFHDVGRYEQIKQYKTFRDLDSIDHADLSAEIICKEGFLDTLLQKDRDMVLTAVRTHNKFAIPEGLDEDTCLLCRLIRDADKIDIFRVVCEETFENSYGVTKEELENSPIAPAVLESVWRHETVLASSRKYPLDYLIGCMAFVFDLNFAESFRLIRERGQYRCKIDTLSFKNAETKKSLERIFAEVQAFIDSRAE